MANENGLGLRMCVGVTSKLLMGLLFLCCFSQQAQAAMQDVYRVQHQVPTVIERGSEVSLSFDIPALNTSNVQDAFLFFRYDGDFSYSQQRAAVSPGGFDVDLAIENPNAQSLEYYFVVTLNNGQRITYPGARPQADPARVEIVDNRQARANALQTGIDYTILSPEPGSSVLPSDVVVAITLFYGQGAIDSTASFQFFLDDENITERAEASDFFFSYSPEEIEPGTHRASLRLVSGTDTTEVAGWQFGVINPQQVASAQLRAVSVSSRKSGSFAPRGQVQLTAQNQEVGGITNDVLKGNIELSGRKGNVRYSAYGLLTSQESPRLQPQNRYGAELYIGNWLEVQGGHIYPTISSLSIAGRRVLGINTAMHAFDGAINAQFLYGKMNRKISNLYSAINVDSVLSGGQLVDTNYSLNFQQNGFGTYQRNVTGGRLSFGRRNTFQWGLNFLKVRDDTTSLTTIRDFEDLMQLHPQLAATLDPTYRSDLEANPDLLSVSGNPRPKDNLIAGSDLMFSLFDNALRFRSEAAVSLLNEDISSGILAGEQNLGIDISEDISNELDRWAWLFIINENMNALPLRFDVEGGETNVEFGSFPTSLLASQSEMNIDLLGNSLRAQYRWIGPNYSSLANSTIRRDIAGITLSDRFQLFDDRLYVTLGYESLNDNVADTRDATTRTQTGRTNLSWFPVDQYMPRVSIGVMYRNRDNDVSLYNPFLEGTGQPEELAIRNFSLTDTSITANPRLSNTYQITSSVSQQFDLFEMTHDASVNFSYLDTRDELFRYGGTQSSSLNIALQSRFRSLPLNTSIGLNVNNTETLGGLSNVNVLGFNLGGEVVLLDNKLNLNTNIAFTQNKIESTSLQISDNGTSDPRDDIYQPATDDSGSRILQETNNNLVILRAGAEYSINSHHALIVNFSYTNISNQLSGLNPPNDKMMQARYIFRF